jgi:hypothetical protein
MLNSLVLRKRSKTVREFSVKGTRIELKKAAHAILMHSQFYSDHMVDQFAVVYADPNKLEPYMHAYNAEEKRAYEQEGLLSARTEVTDNFRTDFADSPCIRTRRSPSDCVTTITALCKTPRYGCPGFAKALARKQPAA